MSNKEIQRKRIMSYFIDAADKIIEQEGIEGITIRKVADYAGYNSATLYNYFENIDHLIFFAAMRYVKDYALALPDYIEGSKNALDTYLRIWDCFCYYSFKRPEIYYAIFFAKLDNDLEEYVRDYYSLFSEELGTPPEGLSTMLLKQNIFDRGMTILIDCVKEGFFTQEDAFEMNELTLLIYESMLSRVIRNKVDFNVALEKTMKYIKQVVRSYQLKEL